MTPFKHPFALVAALALAGLAVAPSSQAKAGGSNIGGSDRGSGLVSDWCRGALGVLDAAEQQATMALVQDDAASARDYLQQGLIAALAKDAKGQSLTHRSLVRGVELSQALDESLRQDPRGLDASVYFLTRYYGFVRRVAYTVDLQYYIPYRNNPGRCASGCERFDIVDFEKQFVVYARDQVGFVLQEFATRAGARVTPVWTSKAFLKLLELNAKYAQEDLNDDNNLWFAKYACVAEALGQLSYKLAHYNAGNRGVYPGDIYAVNASYGDATRALTGMGSACGAQLP